MPSPWKVIGAMILLFAGLLFYFSYKDVVPFLSNPLETAPERLASIWQRDVIELAAAKKLPDGFFNSNEIRWTFGSKTIESWILKIKEMPVRAKQGGAYRLDIFADHFRDGKEFGAILQYQLVDLKSGDMIWELGRTFPLGELTDAEVAKLEEKSATSSTSLTTTTILVRPAQDKQQKSKH